MQMDFVFGSVASQTIAFTVLLVVSSFDSTATAQVVQLPTIQTYSYSGSALVPDRGSTSLYGNSADQAYYLRYGRPRSRALTSSSKQHGNSSLSAHVIDLDELDRRILGLPVPPDPTKPKRQPAVSNALRSANNPVAAIYSKPLQSETESAVRPPRRTLRDVSSGDYMLLLSHPELVSDSRIER